MPASPDLGRYNCFLTNPLCVLAQGSSDGQQGFESEVPVDTVFTNGALGPVQCTAFRLDSGIWLSGAVGYTIDVLLVSNWKGRIRVARGTRVFAPPYEQKEQFVSWFSGPCPITERWTITTTVTAAADPGAGRVSIGYQLEVGCVPIGSTIFYGESVTAVVPP